MSDREDIRQVVVFLLGDDEFAFPITRVQEIIRHSEPREIASDVPWIRGVHSLRGKIVPVCDLAARLGLASQPCETAKIVIVETEAGTAGVIVDEVREVLTIDPSQIDPAPSAGTDVIEGILNLDGRLVLLLDPDRLVGALPAAA